MCHSVCYITFANTRKIMVMKKMECYVTSYELSTCQTEMKSKQNVSFTARLLATVILGGAIEHVISNLAKKP